MKWLIALFSASFAVVTILAAPAFAAKTFVYCSEGSPSIFNPQLATDGTTFNAASKTVYNRLVEFKNGTTEIVPALATGWTVNKAGTEFTFKLRTGVKFHTTEYFKPTREFNADDVLFSFNRMFDPKHPYYSINGGTYEYFRGMSMDKLIKKIEKLDAQTVKFTLNQPEAPFLANMAMDFASILSAEYADQLLKRNQAQKLDWEPVGTGPFIFNHYKKDTLIRFSANPDYFLGKAALDRLVFAITPDASVRTQKLKTGECDLITEPAHSDLHALKSASGVNLIDKAGLNVGYLVMNVEKKPFNDVRVRQAINHALNKSSYIEAIYHGNATVAKNPIPPTMWSYNEKISDYDYDVEKAKKLLAAAGYPNGFTTELWTLPVSRPYNPNGKKMGELMQADLAKIGITVKLVQYDWPTYLAKSRDGLHVMAQFGWTGDNGDPDNFLNMLLGCDAVQAGSNRARWCDQSYEKLISSGKVITDVGQRTKFYQQAQERFKAQAPWVPIAHAKVFRAMRANVTGYKIDPFGADVFYGVDKK